MRGLLPAVCGQCCWTLQLCWCWQSAGVVQGAALMDELDAGAGRGGPLAWPGRLIQMEASCVGTPWGSRMVHAGLSSSGADGSHGNLSLPAATMRRHCGVLLS